MAVAAEVAAPSRSWWGSGRGELTGSRRRWSRSSVAYAGSSTTTRSRPCPKGKNALSKAGSSAVAGRTDYPRLPCIASIKTKERTVGERIWLRGNEGGLEGVQEEAFAAEHHLQELIAEHPELIDGEQVRPDDARRWILIAREKGIAPTPGAGARWSLDHLIVDQDARPTLVEVKLRDNSDIHRKIIGQMLEYAAHASETWTADELRQTFEESVRSQDRDPDKVLGELLQDDDEPDADEFWARVSTSLAAKRLRLLFIADRIPDRMARVVEFLNGQMRDIEVLAVEVKRFRGSAKEMFVPRVLGRTAKTRGPYGSTETDRVRREVDRKAKEHGVAAIWEDAKASLDFSVDSYPTKSGVTYLQRTTILPDNVSVRASHSVTVDGPGRIRITLYPGAVDLCHEAFGQLKEAIRFEAEKPPNVPATRRAPHQWYCRLDERSWQSGRLRLIDFLRTMKDVWHKYEREMADKSASS